MKSPIAALVEDEIRKTFMTARDADEHTQTLSERDVALLSGQQFTLKQIDDAIKAENDRMFRVAYGAQNIGMVGHQVHSQDEITGNEPLLPPYGDQNVGARAATDTTFDELCRRSAMVYRTATVARAEGRAIDFDAPVHVIGRPPVTLGAVLAEAIDGYAMMLQQHGAPLPPSAVVSLGKFALRARLGGYDGLGTVDRKMLAAACAGLYPTVAAQVIEHLGLAEDVEALGK